MKPIIDIAGKNVWVLGAAGYLGQGVTRLLHDNGAVVVCIDQGDRASHFVQAEGLRKTVTPSTFDVRQTALISSFVSEQVQGYGVPDGVVNMTFRSTSKRLEDLSPEEFDETSHVNLTSTFVFCRHVAEAMVRADKGGSLVLFSSMYGMISPDPQVYEPPMIKNPIDYGVGKAGIIQMTRYLSVHYGRQRIRVNCILPDPFPTRQFSVTILPLLNVWQARRRWDVSVSRARSQQWYVSFCLEPRLTSRV